MRYLLTILLAAMLGVGSLSAQKKTTTKKAATSKTTTVKKSSTTSKKKSSSKGKATDKSDASAGSIKGLAQPSASLKGLQKQQAALKQNIKKQEQALQANKAAVAQKLKALERLNGDITYRQKSIDSIQGQISHLNSNISMLEEQLGNLQNQLTERKKSYVKSMRYMAKNHGIVNQLMFIFSAKDFAQAYRRLRFTRQYAAFQRTQGIALEEQQKHVTAKRGQLADTKVAKSHLLAKGTREQQALVAQKKQEQQLVSSLQNKQKTIESVISDQKKKDQALNAKIESLIAFEIERARQRAAAEAKKKAEAEAAAKRKAAELARKKAEAEAKAAENARRIAEAKAAEEKAKAEAKAAASDKARRERAEQLAREAEAKRVAAERKAEVDRERSKREVAAAKKESDNATLLSSADRIVNGGFEANKGRLPSPISGGRIVSHFGQHGVEGLPGVVLDNKGINIRGAMGASVRAIYDGEVSAIFNIGGTMGVLVRHGAYISVYCNLKSVSVSRGQKVSTRQAIGTVGQDNILQFQLRREREKLNPELWLAR